MLFHRLFRHRVARLLLGGSVCAILGGGLGFAGNLSVTTLNSAYSSCNTNESVNVNYYIAGISSVTKNPYDMFRNNIASLMSQSTSEIQIWRNGIVSMCNNWSTMSNVVPGNSQLYHIYQNYDGCMFTLPSSPKHNNPTRLDAQIHFKIGYNLIQQGGTSGGPWSLGYQTLNQGNWTCYPGNSTKASLNQCPAVNVSYGSDKFHLGECLNYRIFWCGDGLVQNGGSYHNNVTPQEVCDPADPSQKNWGTAGCDNQCKPKNVPVVCEDTLLSVPVNSTLNLGQSVTVSCKGQGIGQYKIFVRKDRVDLSQHIIPANGSYTFTATSPGSYQFQCTPLGVPENTPWCPNRAVVYQSPPSPGVCGEKNGGTIYDFDDQGNSLISTNAWLCPVGQWVKNFQYSNHMWTWNCEGAGGISPLCKATEQRCGNGIVDGNGQEQCDDGNNIDTDNCNNQCKPKAPNPGVCGEKNGGTMYDFDDQGDSLTSTNAWLCPGGVASINFQYSNHIWTWNCPGAGGISPLCKATEQRCGNGIVDGNGQEQCDDGNNIDTDNCNNQCKPKAPNPGVCGEKNGGTMYDFDDQGDSLTSTNAWLCPVGQWVKNFQYSNHTWTWNCEGAGGLSPLCKATEQRCGDGIVNGNGQEQCDDGNNVDTDNCNNQCKPKQLFCGDGIVTPPEVCDPADIVVKENRGTDGCSVDCKPKVLEFCGDGIKNGLDECDDGNEINDDGCTNDCRLGKPNLLIEKIADIDEVYIGDSVTYTLHFWNGGNAVAKNVVVVDELPIGYDVETFTFQLPGGVGGTIRHQGNSIILDGFDLLPGDSGVIVIRARIDEKGCALSNPAYISSSNGSRDASSALVQCLAPGECAWIKSSLSGPISVGAYEEVPVDISCVSDGAPALSILLDCGNGQTSVFDNAVKGQAKCIYNKPGTYYAQCLFNGEKYAKPKCVGAVTLKEDKTPKFGICGNGEFNQWEQCDLGFGNNSAPLSDFGGRLFANVASSTIPDAGNYICQNCQLVKKNGGKDCKIDPQTGECMDSEPKCFVQDVTMSVMHGDILPVRWDIEKDKMETVESCAGPQDEGKIIESSLSCSFVLIHGDFSFGTFERNCFVNDWADKEVFAPFESVLGEGITIAPGRSYLENISDYIPDPGPLGEFKVKLDRINFDYCGPSRQVLTSTTDNCCMANFALTKPYVMQKGTITSKDSLQIAGSVPVTDFEAMDGVSIFEKYNLQYYTLIEAEEFDGGVAVDNLIDKFVKKYSSLAVGAGDVGGQSKVAKVPNKSIFVFDGDVTIREDKIMNSGPVTIIVRNGHLTIKGNLERNVMFVVPDGEIRFSNEGVCNRRQIVNGIFISQKGFASVGEDLRNNAKKLSGGEWCFEGGLTLRGVAVGPRLDTLIQGRISELNNWFFLNESEKQINVYEGASFLIEQNPSLYMDTPPGYDDMQFLDVYRR